MTTGGARKGAGRKPGPSPSIKITFKFSCDTAKRLRAKIAPGLMSAFVDEAVTAALANPAIIARFQSAARDRSPRP